MLGDEVRAQLAPNETPLCSELATQFAGHNAIGRDQNPRAEFGMDWDPFSGGISVNSDWTAAALGGVNAGGARGSIADGFSREFAARSCTILLTDRRLAIVADIAPLMTLRSDLRITMSIDRRAVLDIVGKRRLLQWGRVRISFADGSWVMVMMGVFSARAANRLIRAYQSSRGESGNR